MTNVNRHRVPADEIEQRIGATRRYAQHVGRWDHTQQEFLILHSQACLNGQGIDGYDMLADCPFSQALDAGIRDEDWPHLTPFVMQVGADGALTPTDPTTSA